MRAVAAAGRASWFTDHPDGRWPPNLIFQHRPGCGDRCLDDCPVVELDRQSIESGMHGAGSAKGPEYRPITGNFVAYSLAGGSFRVGDTGGASRFFPLVQR